MSTDINWANAANDTYIDDANGTITGVPSGYTLYDEFNDLVHPDGADLF